MFMHSLIYFTMISLLFGEYTGVLDRRITEIILFLLFLIYSAPLIMIV